jgi:DNA-directed RNA polymerase alpha subunit
VYCDSVLVTVREVRNNREAMRILSGFKGDHWQFEIVSRVEITGVQIATSMKQLRQI